MFRSKKRKVNQPIEDATPLGNQVPNSQQLDNMCSSSSPPTSSNGFTQSKALRQAFGDTESEGSDCEDFHEEDTDDESSISIRKDADIKVKVVEIIGHA